MFLCLLVLNLLGLLLISLPKFFIIPCVKIAIRYTQPKKPVQLYEWVLKMFAKQGDKILDTHLGSGTIAVACQNLGFDLVACEIDESYYKKSLELIKIYKT
ncbi:DNA methyltransferase [Campylobacter upsaliensis]